MPTQSLYLLLSLGEEGNLEIPCPNDSHPGSRACVGFLPPSFLWGGGTMLPTCVYLG